MNTNFIYSAPTTVYFGENKLEHLGGELKKYGTRVLVTYGGGSIKKIGLYDRVMEELKKGGFEVYEYGGIEPNPRHTSVNEGAAICKEKGIDVLLAVGGGSTIDATKAMGAAAFYDGDAWDLVTQKAPVANCLPIVTILTLAATGSEMDFFSVISNMEDNDKLGLGHPSMLPRASFLDPTNTYSVSPFQTACGGADILSHLFDTAYFSTQPGLFMVDHFMEGLMKAVIRYTPVAIQEPTHYEARANLMWASSWALNGFTMTGKMQAPSCHMIEHELSAYYDITHGLGLAIVTPRWMKYILDETNAPRFHQFGVNVFGIDAGLPVTVGANAAIDRLSDFFFKTLGLQSTLTELGIDDSKFEIMARKACGGGTMPGYKALNPQDVVNILNMCL